MISLFKYDKISNNSPNFMLTESKILFFVEKRLPRKKFLSQRVAQLPSDGNSITE